jgi:type IV secretion system protein VirB6
MTVLIISSPPLAAMFFQGTVGNFLTYSQFGQGGAARAAAAQQGMPGSYGGGYRPSQASTGQSSLGHQAAGGPLSNTNAGTRGTIVAGPGQLDTIKLQPTGRS